MTTRTTPPRQNGRLKKLGFLIAALPVAWMSLTDAGANILAGNPLMAASAGALGSGRVKIAALPRHVVIAQPAPYKSDAALVQAAKAVLSDSALDPASIWVLANSDPADKARVEAGLRLAERVTRRDLATQLELMRTYATTQDARQALRHLDTAMSVYGENASELLLKTGAGLANPEFRALLSQYRGRTWFKTMLNLAMNQGNEPVGTAAMLLEQNIGGEAVDVAQLPLLLTKLVAAGRTDLANSVATKFGMNAAGAKVFGLAPATTDARFTPLSWQFEGAPGIDVAPTDDGQLIINFSADTAGAILNRAMQLEPGSYVLEMTSRLSERSSGATDLSWSLGCFDGGRWLVVWSQRLQVTAQGQPERMNVQVPASCRQQIWRLSGTNSGNQTGAGVKVGGLNLLRP